MDGRSRHATLQQVADRARVSIATASRGLNGLPIRSESLERVLAAAEQLGYVPNEGARSLHFARTMTMAVVFPRITPIGAELLEGIAERLWSSGYTLLAATAGADDARYSHTLQRLLERRMDAVFCFQPPAADTVLDKYRANGVPVMALLQRGGNGDDLPLLAVQLKHAIWEMFGALTRDGHRRGMAMFRHGGADQIAQYREAAESAGIALEVRETETDATQPDRIVAAITAPDGPRFVIAPYPLAAAIDLACQRRGLSVPGDASIIAVGDEQGAEERSRPLSSIHIDFGKLGREAAQQMLEWLDGSVPPATRTVQVASWVERKSTGPEAAHQLR